MTRNKYHDYETFFFTCGVGAREKLDNMIRSHLRNGWKIQGMSVHYPCIYILFTRGLILEEKEDV